MNKRAGIVSAIVVSSLLLSGAATNSCDSGNYGSIGPSGGEVAAAIVGVSAVIIGGIVLVEVNHSHHNLKGCVANTSNGLLVTADDGHTYALSGETANLKVGDKVHLHGAKHKEKDTKDRTFVVQKLAKDYGPCKALARTTTPTTP